jgi:TolB protein
MKYKIFIPVFILITLIAFGFKNSIIKVMPAFSDTIHFPGETHFKNVRQLTFGGDNAEAYFSFDGKYLIYQKTNLKEGIACDQIITNRSG